MIIKFNSFNIFLFALIKMVDGNINKDKAIEMLPADFPDREKTIEVFSKCSGESKFYFLINYDGYS